MKKKKRLSILALLMCVLLAFVLTPTSAMASEVGSSEQMHRLYNPNSGEHFYTSKASEKDVLVKAGWKYEGIAWEAPASSKTPVYRVYNPNSGEHHYTMDANEKSTLVSIGWNDEGIGWYSDDNKGTPLYRLYNPNATGQYEAGGHHYTKDVNEKKNLIAAGWNDEGIGWYGVSESEKPDPQPDPVVSYPQKLISYLKENGKQTSKEGEYGIINTVTTDTGGKDTYSIIYESPEKEFIFGNIFDDGESTITICMVSSDDVTGNANVYFTAEKNDGSFKKMFYATLSVEKYNKENLTFRDIESGAVEGSDVQYYENTLFQISMTIWDTYLDEHLGFGMKELGFKSYSSQ